MLNRFYALALTTTCSLTVSYSSLACTSFEFGSGNQGGVAHNFDWDASMGATTAFFVNARGTQKSGLNLINSDPVAKWTAKYGSVTYTILAREFPAGGQNEAGLTVHVQEISGAQYPTGPLPVVEAIQFTQYLLDTSATVADALQNAALVRPYNPIMSLHYFLCDSTRACAVIEFFGGAMLTYSGTSLPASALTNSDYPSSVKIWQACQAGPPCAPADNSLERFVQAAGFSANYSSGFDPVLYALSSLITVAQSSTSGGAVTRFHFLNNPSNPTGTFYFAANGQQAWQTFDISQLDYSCKSGGRYFEINPTGSGNQTASFAAYDIAEQQKLVAQTPAPPAWASQIVNYPTAQTTCQ